MVDEGGGDVFLLLSWVMLEGGASMDGRGAEGLGLPVIGCLLERVRVEGGGKALRTILPIEGRPPS